ncbi:MAG: zinc-binding dehydrogenase [Solirubrobacterales bacterium]|nr:zinc-binding dehydrogenase [Solirubrobacterales bacterium]
MNDTMTAARIREHGGPEQLVVETVERPHPSSGEVVVRVAACALNHLDIFVRRGMPGVTVPLPHTTGGDIAGWIEKLGPGVDEQRAGAPVLVDPAVSTGTIGENAPGGLAEFVVVPADNLIALADTDRLIEMAALPIAYGTAHRMLLTRAVLRAGETLVVVGASGGVGVACVQLGKRVGARVIACTSSASKAKLLSGLAADECVVASDGNYSARVWELTGRQGADVVVDYSGVDTWPQSLRCVRPHGRLMTCGATSGYNAVTDLRYLWVREIDIRGSDGWTRDDLVRLRNLVRVGELRPVIHAVRPLSRARDALAELEHRRTFGKVVVVPDALYTEVTSHVHD